MREDASQSKKGERMKATVKRREDECMSQLMKVRVKNEKG